MLAGSGVVDDIVTEGTLLVERHLGLNAPARLVLGQAIALDQAPELGRQIDPDQDDALDSLGARGLEEQRNIEDEQARLAAVGLHRQAHALPDRRMRDRIQPLPRTRIGKDDGSELAPIEPAVVEQHVGTEGVTNLLEGGLAGFDDVARQLIGIDHLCAQVPEHPGDR